MTLGKIHPVILSGGAGTRLWPLSRALYPKQFLGLAGEESPLEQTLARVADPARFAAPLVVCNEEHRFLVGDALRRRGAVAEAILVEPVARNTGPAACTAALKLAERDPQALVLLLPSDHRIAEQARFLAAIDQAAQAAAAGRLVTFGITPDRPETGFGYIHCAEPLEGLPGCHRVAGFVEKPDQATAEGYLASGGYAWNSGMFLFAANRLIEELERHAPDIVAASRAALAAAATDLDFLRLDEESFARAPSISIDYAVMEKTEHAAVVPAEMGWTDLGSWETLWQISDTDTAGNALIGDVVARDARDNYLRSDGRLLAVVGVSGLVVVALRDAVLVCAREQAQDIRQVVDALEAAGRQEHRLHPRVARPWGSYESIDADDGFQAKRLIIKPGASISLQRHRHRAEHWVVVRGQAEVTRDNEVFTLEVNQSTYIPCGAVHRLRNPGTEELHIVEVQSGDYLGEDDIERFEDIYGRD
ncbi:MAG: mannose-1-phosphate guanylyltransferase/mannose-6-phosphate isomerase [Rhodospirillales bacterium]|nr:mannose-1-phosphate guanylyltransferase/mannose-6-phosphate isomerase [Rhodospirillales bacterium]